MVYRYIQMILLIAILTLLIITFSLWDSFVIKRRGNLKGFKKVYHIALLWTSLALAIGLYHKFSISDMLYSIPLAVFLIWVVKDAALGLLIQKDMFYLGSGRWDVIWKRFPGGLLLILKLILLGGGIHLMYWKT